MRSFDGYPEKFRPLLREKAAGFALAPPGWDAVVGKKKQRCRLVNWRSSRLPVGSRGNAANPDAMTEVGGVDREVRW